MKIDHVLKLSLIPLCCLALWGCDVVKLDQHGKPIIPMSAAEAASLKNMTPAALADKFWDHILSEAQKVSGAFGEQTMKEDSSRFVRIHGIVNSLDDSKKRATMTVTSAQHQVVLQIGPIIRGNSIRDAASFIQFDDFKNQVQFARLSKALNKKAMQHFVRPDASWVGHQVDILAAVTRKKAGITDVIPLEMTKR
ncbi:hypothetical protein VA7868_02470 [Vibrio aerogenes CECT 7868]|uniref:Lipoprotein n=1 Tax=Vibrio aerogenes CECT 7868 TaxID=1216006 RepID=A0A1M5Z9W3_9VIBR|nr:DUF2291 family protein [Vibrio aerogenes]SHI21025.1 hypothetical protein VA7868_02470 [Vibrio aerogenes CECT 7868]